jgi:hypothetical protein
MLKGIRGRIEMKKEKELCQNCYERPISFGCFCGKCLFGMKKDKRQRQKNEAYWRAVEFGFEDLWR